MFPGKWSTTLVSATLRCTAIFICCTCVLHIWVMWVSVVEWVDCCTCESCELVRGVWLTIYYAYQYVHWYEPKWAGHDMHLDINTIPKIYFHIRCRGLLLFCVSGKGVNVSTSSSSTRTALRDFFNPFNELLQRLLIHTKIATYDINYNSH